MGSENNEANNAIKLPLYIQIACIFLIVGGIFVILSVGHQIIIPILLALLFAILLRPVVNFFNKKLKFPHVIAIVVSVVLFILFILGIIFFLFF